MRILLFAVFCVLSIGVSNSVVKSLGPPVIISETAFSNPNTRSLSLATAYQATDNTRSAVVTVNLSSSAVLNLSGGQTNSADIVIGATSAVSSGTGTVIGKYRNSLTGTLTIGLGITNIADAPITFALPPGWYFAIRQTGGTVSITSAFDQTTF